MSPTTGREGSAGERRTEILPIPREHGASWAPVVGSVARAEGGPGDDVDLLVDTEPEWDLFDVVAVMQDVEDLLGCRLVGVTEAAVRRTGERASCGTRSSFGRRRSLPRRIGEAIDRIAR